jgi:hypothetical protein
MASERDERLARNEALFRVANERAAAWEERQGQDEEPEVYYCECANPDCRQNVSLLHADYERVRRDPTHFFVVPGHEAPEVESVIEEHDDWMVVRKDPETHPIAQGTDPRSR